MKKTNKLIVGLALAATLFGCGKSQETKTQEQEQKAPAVQTVENEATTNTIAQAAAVTNAVEETVEPKKVFREAISFTNEIKSATNEVKDTVSPVASNIVEAVTEVANTIEPAPTNTVNEVVSNVVETASATTNTVSEVVSNVIETASATTNTVNEVVSNAVDTVAAMTNTVEEMTAPKNVFRGVVALTNTTESTEKTSEEPVTPVITNTVDTVTAPTNAVETATNVVNTAVATTGTVETTVVEQPALPALTKEQEILIAEVVPQIKPFVMNDGMTDEQLFELGAFMHLEPESGTRDLAILYHKAAQNGMDLTLFETAYTNRLKEQQDFIKDCQEGIADARINHKDTFMMSGVTFNINSTNLVENLLTFKDARDSGDYSVVIEGQPFKIFRTQEDMMRLINTRKREVSPNQIVTPYGVYIRQDQNVR